MNDFITSGLNSFGAVVSEQFFSDITRGTFFAVFGFFLAMTITPVYTWFAYRREWWKRARGVAVTGEKAKIFQKLHAKKHQRHIPTMAGIIFVFSTALITVLFNLERSQTWLPVAAMVGAGFVGLMDDIININSKINQDGLRARTKATLIFLVSLIGGLWFFSKLGVSSIMVPLLGTVQIGWLIVPLFVFVVISTANAVNITDGLDGLSGGLSVVAFSTYAIIAFLQGQTGIAVFCMTLVGALLSYTWFNIYPARFFMGDSGSFALGTALAVVSMLTDTVLLLPIIGGVFVMEVGSSLLQILSKKFRGGKKIFKIAPIHHHFEALGWPETRVTMRFWLLGVMCSMLGLLVYMVEYL